ncbi:hypothetical protein BWD10_12225, partial [Neisseria zoodegmatis]
LSHKLFNLFGRRGFFKPWENAGGGIKGAKPALKPQAALFWGGAGAHSRRPHPAERPAGQVGRCGVGGGGGAGALRKPSRLRSARVDRNKFVPPRRRGVAGLGG